MRRVRFSLDPDTPVTASDRQPGVQYGALEGGIVYTLPTPLADAKGASHPVHAVRLLPPVSPSKIVCVGRNYPEHAKELGNEVPAEPLIFLKPPSTLVGDGDDVVHPSFSERLDFEGELGVVIGRRARNVGRRDADDYVYGYTVVNDVTARDLQRRDGQWTRGKGCDTFCPVGPWVVKRDDVDFATLRVRTFVDDAPRQDGSVTEMMFGVGAIIEYVSRFMTLEPGDLIATGTPPGVGPVTPGQTVRVEIPGVGTLTNRVVREDPT